MATSSSDTVPLDIEIVGLVRDMKYSSVKRDIPPVFFTPHRQARQLSTLYFYVRTASNPSTMLRSMASVVQRLDPMLPVENLRTMPEEIRLNTFEDRMITTLAASFAMLATLLASIGLYGVLARDVGKTDGGKADDRYQRQDDQARPHGHCGHQTGRKHAGTPGGSVVIRCRYASARLVNKPLEFK